MLSVEEARERILAHARPVDAGAGATAGAAGRVPVSFTIDAAVDVPPFDNSAMDGFALRAADAPGELRLVAEVAAGERSLPDVPAGAAVRIMTGAPLPPGTDAVVPLEQAEELGGDRVRLPATTIGAFVRRSGRGHAPRRPRGAAGRTALARERGGARLARPRRGARCGAGRSSPSSRPATSWWRQAEPLEPGQIHDANSASLAAAVREAGGEPMLPAGRPGRARPRSRRRWPGPPARPTCWW